MIFSELYGAYYTAVSRVLRAALDHPLTPGELRSIIRENAFGESVPVIEEALTKGRWPLLRPSSPEPLIRHVPSVPVTLLEKRWLNAVYLDPRIRLFTDEEVPFPETEPLFTKDDIHVFDRYANGDPFEDEEYIVNFRRILDALKKGLSLHVSMKNRKGETVRMSFVPHHLEYSEKDDKFRLIGTGKRQTYVVNVARITELSAGPAPDGGYGERKPRRKTQTVTFELTDRRNAMERILMHFAHFEKEVENLGEGRYRVKLVYDTDDESELVIRILSFGPMIRVTSPESFIGLIRERLISQKNCGQ